jgi:F420-dependent oxidoreductase-like protein
MRFSIWPNLQQPWADVVEVADRAEATGWDGVWIADHFMGDGGGFGPVHTPTLEATATLAALAATTTRVRLGSLVFGTTYRHPAVLANWAATVDHVSAGRLTLGVGAGWQENEHEQYGIDLPPVRARIDRFAETCAVLTSLLREEHTTFAGDWFTLTEAWCEPKPVQARLPLLVGGKGDRMLAITAQFADAWNMWALPDTFAERSSVLDQTCAAVDRDPATIERSTQALIMLTDDRTAATSFVEAVAPRAAIGGTVEQVADTVAEWQAVGVDEVIIPDFVLGRGARRAEAMDALIETLRPRFGS